MNLGLIPSSEEGWPVACTLLKHGTGGWLHIHGNVTSGKSSSQDCTSRASQDHSKQAGYTCNKQLKPEWQDWANSTTERLKPLLQTAHCEQGVQEWKVTVRHLEHIKSYAPHVDHLVLDIECRPVFEYTQ